MLPWSILPDVGYYLQMGEAAVNLPLVVDGQMTTAKTGVTVGR